MQLVKPIFVEIRKKLARTDGMPRHLEIVNALVPIAFYFSNHHSPNSVTQSPNRPIIQSASPNREIVQCAADGSRSPPIGGHSLRPGGRWGRLLRCDCGMGCCTAWLISRTSRQGRLRLG